MKYRKTPHVAPLLSVDSLVDIFMNAFAIVMFSSIALALSLGPQSIIKDETQKVVKQPKTVRLKLPLTRNVSTVPIYIWMRSDGIKVINDNSTLQWKTTNRIDIDGQIKVEPILNSSISSDELNNMSKILNKSENHIIFLVHPEGVKYFKQAREIFEGSKVPSGWIPWSQDVLFLVNSGRTHSEVQ